MIVNCLMIIFNLRDGTVAGFSVDQTEWAVEGCDWQGKWFPPEIDWSWLCRVRPLRLGCGGGPACETVAVVTEPCLRCC